jgi:hypothetical protein
VDARVAIDSIVACDREAVAHAAQRTVILSECEESSSEKILHFVQDDAKGVSDDGMESQDDGRKSVVIGMGADDRIGRCKLQPASVGLEE